MKCSRHPSMEQFTHKPGCLLCEDWTSSSGVIEADLSHERYAAMSQHVLPGIRGIRTKGQYRRLLKSKGLTDDISTKELVACARDTSKRDRLREQRFQALGERLKVLALKTMR